MNAKEAREQIELHKDHTQQLATGACFNPVCMEAKGYLDALDGEEVKALVDTLRNIADQDYRGNRSQDSVNAFKALESFKKAVGK